MATKKTTRTHAKTIGQKPHTGRRYVQNGKVRIEWYEDGKRRSRTIGPHSPAMRDQADQTLQELLAGHHEPAAADSTAKPGAEATDGETSLRGLALSVLDAADMIADGIRNAARELMRELDGPADESNGG